MIPTLPDTLRALEEAGPERFLRAGSGNLFVCAAEGNILVLVPLDGGREPKIMQHNLPMLRTGLEQEIEARGWGLEQMSSGSRHGADIYREYDPSRPDRDCRLSGEVPAGGCDSPAHALALALLAALSATAPALSQGEE